MLNIFFVFMEIYVTGLGIYMHTNNMIMYFVNVDRWSCCDDSRTKNNKLISPPLPCLQSHRLWCDPPILLAYFCNCFVLTCKHTCLLQYFSAHVDLSSHTAHQLSWQRDCGEKSKRRVCFMEDIIKVSADIENRSWTELACREENRKEWETKVRRASVMH